jgi:hypothetical protein
MTVHPLGYSDAAKTQVVQINGARCAEGDQITVTLDGDVAARVKRESQSRGASFRDTLNDLLKVAFVTVGNMPRRRTLKIKPVHRGCKPVLNYASIESLLAYGERAPAAVRRANGAGNSR